MMERKEAIEKYERAKRDNNVDEDIIPLLEKINASENCYTTSSCSGRIVLLNLPEIGDKKEAKFLGKWHSEINVKELKRSMENYTHGYLFFLMQSPIIHVVCSGVQDALAFQKLCIECGFKYTTIKTISHNVLLEVLSTENINIPFGENGEIYVYEEQIRFFVKMANKLLRRSKRKLKCLEEKLSYFPLSFS